MRTGTCWTSGKGWSFSGLAERVNYHPRMATEGIAALTSHMINVPRSHDRRTHKQPGV